MIESSQGRLYFWGERALYLGPGLAASVHAHHAIQVCVPLSGVVRLRAGPGTRWREYAAALIPANQPHESGTPTRPQEFEMRDGLQLIAGALGMLLFFP